jgi:pilus assembly protein CpaF
VTALLPDDVVASVRASLAARGAGPTDAAVLAALAEQPGLLGQQEVLGLAGRLRAELVGAGPLEPLLADPRVTDVLVNGPHEVFVDRGEGLERAGVSLPDAESLRGLAVRLATACGRRLDDSVPWVDATLPDGTRVHAVLPPLAPDGPLLSLRVLRRRALSMPDLVVAGAVPAEIAGWLERLVTSRQSFLVTGGTGAGKTTLLAALLSLVPADERVVLVEDTPELRPTHAHTVRLVARAANVEGSGGVGLDLLVRQALRMRPDRLVVGEVRGAEVVDLLAALNTGHEGGCGTVHANGAADLPARLEALGTAARLDRLAVHSQVAAAVRVVVHVCRYEGRRRVAEVAVVQAVDGLVQVVPALVHGPDGRVREGPGAGHLARMLQP